MTIAELVAINVALDVSLIGGLAYAMSHPRRLTPHRVQTLEEVETQEREQVPNRPGVDARVTG
jgi:hypothetical protein